MPTENSSSKAPTVATPSRALDSCPKSPTPPSPMSGAGEHVADHQRHADPPANHARPQPRGQDDQQVGNQAYGGVVAQDSVLA